MSRDSTSPHLDVDALADVLAGEHDASTHLATCEPCRTRLDELAEALPAVSAALAALPAPTPPDGLEERLLAAVAAADLPGTTNVLPMASRRTRWLPALGAAAAAAVVVTGGVLVAQQGSSTRTTNDNAVGAPTYAVNASGNDYRPTPGSLSAALPGLLAGDTAERAQALDGSAQAGSEVQQQRPTGGSKPSTSATKSVLDPLAELRTTAGLARCLASLTDPSEEGLPLALDYASFQGTPALVVVLPSPREGKVDVLVVPAGCARADGQLLYFTRLPKP